MSTFIKIHTESKSVHLSRKNIERYVDYKIEKIYKKAYTKNIEPEDLFLYIDQREKGLSSVKLVTKYNKKDIVIVVKGHNPYQLIKEVLEKLKREMRKIKDKKHSLSGYHSKDKAESKFEEMTEKVEEFIDEEFDLEDELEDFFDKFDNKSEEDIDSVFEKLINDF